jgi:hypothetical protein
VEEAVHFMGDREGIQGGTRARCQKDTSSGLHPPSRPHFLKFPELLGIKIMSPGGDQTFNTVPCEGDCFVW